MRTSLATALALSLASACASGGIVPTGEENQLMVGGSASLAGTGALSNAGTTGAMVMPRGGSSGMTQAPGAGATAMMPPGGDVGTAGTTSAMMPVAGSTAQVPEEMPMTSSTEPKIPAVNGECPDFTSGSISVGGLSGITVDAGPMGEGNGALIFYWHGTGSTAGEYRLMMPSSVISEIKAEGGIIISPQRSLGSGGDCSGTATFSKDDFNVADQIAACAVQNYKINPKRIYTTGCSAGGLQAGCMASLRSSYIAAAVPNSGGSVFPQMIQDPSHIPAMMTMHGGAADWVIVSFSTTSATIDNQYKEAGGFVVNCNHAGSHCGAPGDLYSAGWEFMKAHPFGTPSPYTSGLPESFPSYCEIL